ncbi:MAG: hypothetical protein JRJ41_02800 [Deltaproteobacteria bacterium]|nr:hypothetical protein [Deltaproteobacteria bacterium]
MQNRDEPINVAIMENELANADWELNELAWELIWWIDFFNIAFFKEQPVPMPVLTFERSRVNNLGFYRIGFNDFAVRNQINLNRLYLGRPLSELLQTLLHELMHSMEYIYISEKKRTKNSWYHSKAFRLKMLEFGILTNEKGVHVGIGDPFVFLLRKHGVDFNSTRNPDGFIVLPPKKKAKGKSKLRKWSCGCQNARIGKSGFEATCDICFNKFELFS